MLVRRAWARVSAPAPADGRALAGPMTPFADLLICLRFFSRLPVPGTERERMLGAGGLASAAPMAPVAGLVLALLPVSVLWVSSSTGLAPLVAATLALASLVMLTGALHEDALADCADGFGGGRTRERKLAIMRESAVGAFGAAAIAFSLLLRCSAVAAAAAEGRGGTAILVAAVLSRATCFVPLAMLPPARSEGRGAAAGGLGRRRHLAVCATAFAISMAVTAATRADVGRALVAMLAAALAALAMTALAWRQIGGQTGDVAGAAQQVSEIAVLLVFAAAAG